MKHWCIRLDKREELRCDTAAVRRDYAARLVTAAYSLCHPRKPHLKCDGIMIDEGVSGNARELFDPNPYGQTMTTLLIDEINRCIEAANRPEPMHIILRCRADITTDPNILIDAGKAAWLYQLPRAHWDDRCESEGYSPDVAWDMRPHKLGPKVKQYEADTGNCLVPYAGAHSVRRQPGQLPTVSAWAVNVRPVAYQHVAQWLTSRAKALGLDHVSMAWKHHDVDSEGRPYSWESGGVTHYTRPIPTPIRHAGSEALCFKLSAKALHADGLHLVTQHYTPTRTRLDAETLELVEDYGTLQTEVRP